MLESTLTKTITKSEDFKDFSVLSVLEDYENGRVVAAVRCGNTQLPLVLWSGADYDPARNWKNGDVVARVKELLPAALA